MGTLYWLQLLTSVSVFNGSMDGELCPIISDVFKCSLSSILLDLCLGIMNEGIAGFKNESLLFDPLPGKGGRGGPVIFFTVIISQRDMII